MSNRTGVPFTMVLQFHRRVGQFQLRKKISFVIQLNVRLGKKLG